MQKINIPNEKIIGDKIYLRQLKVSDASDEYVSWLKDVDINRYLQTKDTTVEELKDYIKQKMDDKNVFFVGIFDNETNIHIGNIKLEPIEWDKREATFGILIGNKNFLGRGIGTIATSLIVKYAFEKLGLQKIILGVIIENKPAIRCYEKVGFKITKTIKNGIENEGKFFDKIIMEIDK